jgi:hypothetical protein
MSGPSEPVPSVKILTTRTKKEVAPMKVLLLVTWIVNNAVNSYQVEFQNRENCDAAKVALLTDQKRIIGKATAVPLGFQVPEVSAICVNQ